MCWAVFVEGLGRTGEERKGETGHRARNGEGKVTKMEAAVFNTSRSGILALYRDIRRLHRRKFDPAYRQLADRFLKNEFKLHKEVDEKMARIFLGSWADYRKDLAKAESLESFARDLTSEEIESMSDEALEQLDLLRASVEQIVQGKHPEQLRQQAEAQQQGDMATPSNSQPFESEVVKKS